MKLAKRFAALLMGATLAVGSLAGLAGCGGTDGTNGTEEDQIRAVYDLYVENCAENNTTPQSYQEWLNAIKGADGQNGKDGTNGITPHIGKAADGEEEGYWYFGTQKTEYKAVGEDGEDGATPSISDDGYWVLGGQKSTFKAVGEDGKSAYQLYVEHYNGDGEPLGEEEWLASLYGMSGGPGPAGAPGKSAYEVYLESYADQHEGSTDGALDRDAWLASLKGEKGDAGTGGGSGGSGGGTGADGKSAYELYVEDYKSKHEGSDAGVLDQSAWLESLKGEKGDTGDAGTNGSTWLYGTSAPASNQGNLGDLYLNTTTWDVFAKEDDGTGKAVWKVLGCLKPMDPLTAKYGYDVNLTSSGSTEIDITGLAPGAHFVTAEVDSIVGNKAYQETTKDYSYIETSNAWQIKVGDASYYSILSYDDSINGSSTHSKAYQAFCAFIVVKEGDTKATISAGGVALKGRIIIEENVWTMEDWGEKPAKKNDRANTVRVPINGYGMAKEDCIKFNLPNWEGAKATDSWWFEISTVRLALDGSKKYVIGEKTYSKTSYQWKMVGGSGVSNMTFGTNSTVKTQAMDGREVYLQHSAANLEAQNAIWASKLILTRQWND